MDIPIALVLLFQVVVILAFSRVVRRLFVPLGQPAVVGEMAAGLMLGPSCFGWLMPRAAAALFAPNTLPALSALSQVGLVLFMFLVGLRLDSPHVDARRRLAIVTSATSIAVPFVLGSLVAVAVHERLSLPGVGRLPFALFIGTAMSITAFPVLARILIDHRLLTTEIGVVAIACAAFDDVTGWMILSGVTALVHATDLQGFIARIVLFAGYLGAMIAIVRPALRWFAQRRGPRFGCHHSIAGRARAVRCLFRRPDDAQGSARRAGLRRAHRAGDGDAAGAAVFCVHWSAHVGATHRQRGVVA
jgi:Kef-type K+ transport system membrane component KefB